MCPFNQKYVDVWNQLNFKTILSCTLYMQPTRKWTTLQNTVFFSRPCSTILTIRSRVHSTPKTPKAPSNHLQFRGNYSSWRVLTMLPGHASWFSTGPWRVVPFSLRHAPLISLAFTAGDSAACLWIAVFRPSTSCERAVWSELHRLPYLSDPIWYNMHGVSWGMLWSGLFVVCLAMVGSVLDWCVFSCTEDSAGGLYDLTNIQCAFATSRP